MTSECADHSGCTVPFPVKAHRLNAFQAPQMLVDEGGEGRGRKNDACFEYSRECWVVVVEVNDQPVNVCHVSSTTIIDQKKERASRNQLFLADPRKSQAKYYFLIR